MQTFRAMNTEVTVVVPGREQPFEATHAARVRRIFADNELRFSRFRDDSELSALNRSEGPTRVSSAMFEVLVRARRYVELSDGIFDPCVGGALVASGYDRSFVPGGLDRDRTSAHADRTTFRAIELDVRSRSVTRPPHVTIDLGGIVKGMTVDQASSILPSPSVVDAGGDCAMRADADGDGYLVDVEDPFDATRTRMTFRVHDGAVATSAPNRRRWRVGNEVRHHLVDPRTGSSAETDLAQVTVSTESAELADVLAKTAYLLGEEEALRFLGRQPRVSAVLVRRDGSIRTFGDLEVHDE